MDCQQTSAHVPKNVFCVNFVLSAAEQIIRGNRLFFKRIYYYYYIRTAR